MTNKFVLDANIVLEVFLDRARKQQVLSAVAALEAQQRDLCVSSLSVSHFMYFIEREKKSKVDANSFMAQFSVLDVNEQDVQWAFANDQGDFEDALQVACAIRHGCKKFLTLDQELKKRHHKHIATSLVQ